jgi:hypothetical protein
MLAIAGAAETLGNHPLSDELDHSSTIVVLSHYKGGWLQRSPHFVQKEI